MTYDEAVVAIRNEFADCADFNFLQTDVGACRFTMANFKGLTDRVSVGDAVLRPMLDALHAGVFDGDYRKILRNGSVMEVPDVQTAVGWLLRGEVFLAVERGGEAFFCLANVHMGVSRAIGEPETDVTVRGPRLGFVEDSEKNMTMLRQFLRTGDLKFVSLVIGELSHTRITLAYLESRADGKLVNDLSRRIATLNAQAVTDSGYLEMLLQGRRSPLFPLMGSTEKVDKAASKLLAGRVGILVDGSPFVLTAPYVFAESIQSAEDYLRTPYYATAVRCLRLFALIVSIFLPAVLVAFGEFHSELLPDVILQNLHETRAELPFTLFWECLVALLIFELVREVGVRMPRTVGDAVGIVASIILGDAAVEAKLASSTVIMAVALSAVTAFIVPTYMYSTVLLRFAFLFLAGAFGLYGIFLGLVMLVAPVSRLDSFGVPYLSPLSPLHPQGLEDFLLAIPKKTLGRREEL